MPGVLCGGQRAAASCVTLISAPLSRKFVPAPDARACCIVRRSSHYLDSDDSSGPPVAPSSFSLDDSDSCDSPLALGGHALALNSTVAYSLLDSVVLALWEEAAEAGLFRYDVTACSTRTLPGHHGFVAQLNIGRATKKRPTEFQVDQVRPAGSTLTLIITLAGSRSRNCHDEPLVFRNPVACLVL